MRVNQASCTGEVFNTAKYAEAVHDGTSPHMITARRGKALKFTAGGRTVYARSVRHPGTRPRRWMTTAAGAIAASGGYRWSPER